MATKYASHAQAMRTAKTSGAGAGSLRGDEALANACIITSTYTMDGTEAVGDVIKLTAPKPEGLTVVPALSRVSVPSAAAGTLTAKIGTPKDDDSIGTGLNIGAAGNRDLGTIYTESNPASEEVIATLTAVTGPTADRTITFYLVCRSVS